jgi:type IV pilus biogenesis protein CpaD/CtpE
MRIAPRLLAIASIALLASGCAVNRTSATLDDNADLAKIKTLHVVKLPKDERGIDVLIADKFRSRGLTVSTGAAKPDALDALVTYADRWMWDITMYMIELTVTIREANTDYPIAAANSFHTSLTRLSPKEMVDEVVENIYAKGKRP